MDTDYSHSIHLASDEDDEAFYEEVVVRCDDGVFTVDDGFESVRLSMSQAAGLHREIGQMLIRYNRYLHSNNPTNSTPKEIA